MVELSGSLGHYIIILVLESTGGKLGTHQSLNIWASIHQLTCWVQVEHMQKASIKAVALNKDVSWEGASRALKSSQVCLIFTSLEYLLQNSYMKKLYIQEESHIIYKWAENFWKDYSELKTLWEKGNFTSPDQRVFHQKILFLENYIIAYIVIHFHQPI